MSKREKTKKEVLFFVTVQEQFQYLRDEYGFRRPAKTSRSTFHSVEYKSATTLISINYDMRDQYIYLDIIRLVDGQIPPRFYTEDGNGVADTHNYFSLHELLARVSSASVKEIAMTEYGLSDEIMTQLLVNQAALLRRYGSRILTGDFDEFDADGYTDRRYIRSSHPPYSYVRNESA